MCPGVLVANSILYSTKEALKKLAWHVLFAFSYLAMLSDITPFITFLHRHSTRRYQLAACMDSEAAIVDILSDHAILAPPLPSPLTYRYG